MTKKELGEKYKDIPEIIASSIKMKEANEAIPIYKGPFVLEHKKTRIELTGKISFEWFPSSFRIC